MVLNKDDLDAKHVLFIDKIADNLPFIFDKDKDFNFAELAGLSIIAPRIGRKFFEDIVEAQAEAKSFDIERCKKAFNSIRSHISETQKRIAEPDIQKN